MGGFGVDIVVGLSAFDRTVNEGVSECGEICFIYEMEMRILLYKRYEVELRILS